MTLAVITHTPLTSRQPERIVVGSSETIAQRIKRLQGEARLLAAEHVAGLTAALNEVERLAAEIADGGDAHPPGVRDICRKLAEESAGKAQSINAIMERKP